jgi:hypothetical protein
MILFENVIQVLHRSVSTAVAQRSFLLTVGDRGAVNRCYIASALYSSLGSLSSLCALLPRRDLQFAMPHT